MRVSRKWLNFHFRVNSSFKGCSTVCFTVFLVNRFDSYRCGDAKMLNVLKMLKSTHPLWIKMSTIIYYNAHMIRPLQKKNDSGH